MSTVSLPAVAPQPIVVVGRAVTQFRPERPRFEQTAEWLVTVQLTLAGSPAQARVWMEQVGENATVRTPRDEIADDLQWDLFPFRSWTEAEMAAMVDVCIATAWGTV
jgi:hypothetical protein